MRRALSTLPASSAFQIVTWMSVVWQAGIVPQAPRRYSTHRKPAIITAPITRAISASLLKFRVADHRVSA